VLRLLLFSIGLAVSLAGCGGTISNERARVQLGQTETTPPVPTAFNYCYGHGCKNVATTALSPEEWREIQRLIDPPTVRAIDERKRLATAVGRFETFVGAKLGTGNDRGGTFEAFGRQGQLDCVDEATNTTTFLRMLEHAGLLKWHAVSEPVSRSILVTGWPHSTATVVEVPNGGKYAVDSWALDNGMDASVILLQTWNAGLAPE
jgi:hypothetical protein